MVWKGGGSGGKGSSSSSGGGGGGSFTGDYKNVTIRSQAQADNYSGKTLAGTTEIYITDKGIDFIKKNRKLFDLYKSSFEKAARGNAQLNRPSRYDARRKDILELYADRGWKAVDERFNKNIGVRKYSGVLKSMIPVRIKRTIKKLK